jgi:upstream activation factor subunit UAF30
MAKSAKRAKKAAGRSAKKTRSTRTTRSTKSAKSSRSTKRAKSSRSAKSAKSARGARKTKSTGRKASKRTTGRKPNAAFMAPVTPSPALAEIVGDRPIPRTEVTKRLWAYIKKNDLQDAKNRRTIKADAALRPVFGGKSAVNMFEMTRLVGRHLE